MTDRDRHILERFSDAAGRVLADSGDRPLPHVAKRHVDLLNAARARRGLRSVGHDAGADLMLRNAASSPNR